MREIDWGKVGREAESHVFQYVWKDVVLYALGIGAQIDELDFLYENSTGGLKVFPSFAAIACGEFLRKFAKRVEGNRFLHGEQMVHLHKPIPPEGKLTVEGRVANVFDKGKAAVIHFESKGYSENGEHLFDVEHITFHVGAGGFGGDPGPKAVPFNPPEGVSPDVSVSFKIPENQAALYRLSGDLNFLHIDPAYAKLGGFDKPILHGLCTYGFATRAVLYGLCQGNLTRFKEFKVRFADVVYPGETLTTEAWKESGGRYIIQARTERAVVLRNAHALIAS